MTLGDIIKAYRKEHECSMDDFAKRCKLSKAYISILERNKNPSTGREVIPSLTTIKQVADAMCVDFNDLLSALDGSQQVRLTEEKTIPRGYEPLPTTVKRPLIGDIACGDPIIAEQNIRDYVDVPDDVECDFCLRCHGDSMVDAHIQDGDIVYIRIQPDVEDGEIAAVRIGDEATLKRVFHDTDSITLIPANASYRPRTYTGPALDDIQIEGKMVGFTHWCG
jgi:repressor LexA